jgi:hypothetical protein
MSSWIESRGRSRDRQEHRDRSSGRYRGESSHGRSGRQRKGPDLQGWEGISPEEQRALSLLWQEKEGSLEADHKGLQTSPGKGRLESANSDAITIVPCNLFGWQTDQAVPHDHMHKPKLVESVHNEALQFQHKHQHHSMQLLSCHATLLTSS